MRAPPGTGITHTTLITDMLDGNFLPIPPLNSDVPDLVPDAIRGMKAAWDTWAKSAMSELDRVLSQTHTYGTSLTRVLQPQHTEDEGLPRASPAAQLELDTWARRLRARGVAGNAILGAFRCRSFPSHPTFTPQTIPSKSPRSSSPGTTVLGKSPLTRAHCGGGGARRSLARSLDRSRSLWRWR